MTERLYLECVKCHSSGQSPDGAPCHECKGQGRWEIVDGEPDDRPTLPASAFHDIAVDAYREQLSED